MNLTLVIAWTWVQSKQENLMVQDFLYFLSLHSVPNFFLSFVPYEYA